MLESKNILLDIGRAQNTDKAGPAGLSQDAATEKSGQFSALLGNAVGKFKAAESGNKAPLSAQQSAAADSKLSGLLSTRVLQGGTALIVAGPEPTDAGLLAFARAQGIDPEALGLAAAETPQQSGATLNAAAFKADTVLSESASSSSAATKETTPSNLMIRALSPGADTSSIAIHGLAAKTVSKSADLDNPMLTINPNAAKAVPQRPLLESKFLSPQQHLSSARHSNLASVGDDASTAALKPHEAANTDKKTLHIKAETTISSGRLEAGAASLDGGSVATIASQLKIGPKMAEEFLQRYRHRQNLAPTKMDAINLTEAKALTASASSALSSAPVLSASVGSAPLFAEATATSGAAASSLKSDLSAAAPAEDARQEMLRRQDDYTQLSRQLTDALGKRLTAQIQRGSWHVEMELHPKSLGRVEVQLEMKNGELEARFIAANATTRDLINEGMPRLREAFQEHGTETAYKDLGTANQGAHDGKPTASGNGAPGSDKRLDPGVEGVSGKNSQQLSADGLDVLV